MPKSWVEIRAEVPLPLVDAVSNFLIEQGSTGVIQEESRGRSRKDRESVVAFFPNSRSFPGRKRKILKYLSSISGSSRGTKHRTPSPARNALPGFSLRERVIREEKWAEAWKGNFKTFHATPHLVIRPPWEDYPERKGEVVIRIDPGMAFGTGSHPSTRMCLAVLEELIPSFPRPPTVLDVGTGSGILSIAAAKLGAEEILALDIDPIAVSCARENAAANGSEGRIEFREGSPAGLRRRFDIVVANLLPQELSALTRPLAGRIQTGGTLIISGILRGQKKEIGSLFVREGLTLRSSRELKGWACLGFRKAEGVTRGIPRGEEGKILSRKNKSLVRGREE